MVQPDPSISIPSIWRGQDSRVGVGWDRCFRVPRRCRAGGLVIPLAGVAGQRNGAVGENRTHDLSLTKGLRYHYATTATVVFRTYKWRDLNGFRGPGRGSLKGALL